MLISERTLRLFIENCRKRISLSKLGKESQSALARYAVALDHADWSVSFRELWSLLEFLTDTEKNSFEPAVRRMSAMYQSYDYALEVAKHLRVRRNLHVHFSPEDADSEILMGQTRQFVEPLLEFYIHNPFGLRSKAEVGGFMDLPRDKKDRRRLGHLLSSADKFRS